MGQDNRSEHGSYFCIGTCGDSCTRSTELQAPARCGKTGRTQQASSITLSRFEKQSSCDKLTTATQIVEQTLGTF